jgi:hypothetical protein
VVEMASGAVERGAEAASLAHATPGPRPLVGCSGDGGWRCPTSPDKNRTALDFGRLEFGKRGKPGRVNLSPT